MRRDIRRRLDPEPWRAAETTTWDELSAGCKIAPAKNVQRWSALRNVIAPPLKR